MDNQAARVGLIWCSQDPRGEYASEMVDAFRREGERWDILNPFTASMRDTLGDYDRYVISGSEHSVNDDSTWVHDLLEFIRTAAAASLPLVGICFGCQALAKALGGEVGDNPDGGFYFNVEPILADDSLQNWLDENQLPALRVVESHGECVTRLPDRATCLAGSERTRVEVFIASDRILGIQGHPELSAAMTLNKFLPIHSDGGRIDEAGARQLKQDLETPLAPEGMLELIRLAFAGELTRVAPGRHA